MDQEDRNRSGTGAAGPANTPPFGAPRATDSAADHQLPESTGGATGSGSKTETEQEMERTRDVIAERAAPAVAEKTQEMLRETAQTVSQDPAVRDQVRRTADAVQHDAQRMASEKIGQAGRKAEERVNQGMSQAADRLETAAGRLDQLASERLDSAGGMQARAGRMTHTVADTIESVANYLRSNDAQGLRSDLEHQVRDRPMETLLMGVATGWVVGKILR